MNMAGFVVANHRYRRRTERDISLQPSRPYTLAWSPTAIPHKAIAHVAESFNVGDVYRGGTAPCRPARRTDRNGRESFRLAGLMNCLKRTVIRLLGQSQAPVVRQSAAYDALQTYKRADDARRDGGSGHVWVKEHSGPDWLSSKDAHAHSAPSPTWRHTAYGNSDGDIRLAQPLQSTKQNPVRSKLSTAQGRVAMPDLSRMTE